MSTTVKLCPRCHAICPVRALRCRTCQRWFESRLEPTEPHFERGALVLLIALAAWLVLAHVTRSPATSLREEEPAAAAQTARERLLPSNAHVTCPTCGGSGLLVGRLTRQAQTCWRCQGRAMIFPGLEQRRYEPLDPMPDARPPYPGELRVTRPGVYGGTP